MSRRARALLALASLALTVLLPGLGAHATGPAIERLSYDPVPGDYTLILKVENFQLSALNGTGGDGLLVYLLNDFPCTSECAGGQPYRTNATHFTYHRLVTGDTIRVELRTAAGRALDPPVVHAVTVRTPDEQCLNDGQLPEEPHDDEEAPETEAPPLGQDSCGTGVAPFLAISSGIPNAGDYTMRLRIERFTLVQPDEAAEGDLNTGFIRYSHNGVVCATCSTTDTAFTFEGVQVGDRVGAELVRPDGSSLAPRKVVVVTVAQPAIRIVSGIPQETNETSKYTMRVIVTGFTLQAPGGPVNAGSGYILYLVKHQGGVFEPATATAPCTGSPRTASTTFSFCGLEEGDEVTATLVDASGQPVGTQAAVLEVRQKPPQGFLAPAVGPMAALLVLGLAALRRK